MGVSSPSATPPAPVPGPVPATLAEDVHGDGGTEREVTEKQVTEKQEVYRDGTRICRAIAGPAHIGLVCSAGTGGRPVEEVIEQILDGDPVPECWHAPLTEAELRSLGLAQRRPAWVWVSCLTGIDPRTFRVDPDGVQVRRHYQPVPEDELIEVTERQQRLIDHFSGHRSVPAPILGLSPHPIAVVHSDASFFNAGAELGEHEIEVRVADLGVQLRGRVLGIEVVPGDGTRLACAGNGHRARPGQGPQDLPGGCWHSYGAASLGLPLDAFEAELTSRWLVEINRGHGWEEFHQFDKITPSRVQVNEIQAIVVP